MKKTLFTLFILFSALSLTAVAGGPDLGLSQEKMIFQDDKIFVVSSFEDVDYLCMYNRLGEFLGEVPFTTKILSWKLHDDLLVVFSRSRDKEVCYLVAFNMKDGQRAWEKAIYAPSATEALPQADSQEPAS